MTALSVLAVTALCASDSGSSLTGGAGTAVSAAGPAGAPASTNAPPTRVVPPAKVNLPPQLAEVVRLAQSGVDESVILSYVKQSPAMPPLSADQILYLRDVGLSSDVLQALTNKGNGAVAASQPTAETSAPPAAETAAPTGSASTATTAQAPPPSSDAGYFYDSLAPYGSWLYVPAYGWCWQPTAVVVDPFWRPYSDDGCWYWSDWGWYWNSYYSWGWAPFHYGRWCQYPGYGWLWCPDRVWGASWVCWRNGSGYCGWAPLPPGAFFTAGVGWTFNGLAVGFDFGFGLGSGCFTFVGYDHFYDRRPFHRFFRGREADDAFRRGRMNNDFAAGSDHHFVNRGVDPKQIESATHAPIHQVAVREMPRDGGRAMAPGRVEQTGSAMVVYRPGPQTPAPRNPTLTTLRERPVFSSTTTRPGVSRASPSREEVPRGANLLTTPPRRRSEQPSASSREPTTRPAEPTSRPPESAVRPAEPAGGSRSFTPAAPAGGGHSESPGATPSRTRPQARYQAAPAYRAPTYSYSAPKYSYTPARPTTPAWTRSTPTYSWNRSSAAFTPQYRSSTPQARSGSPPRYDARPSFSARSFSAPSFSARSAPSSGGFSHSSGVSHSGGGGGGWGSVRRVR